MGAPHLKRILGDLKAGVDGDAGMPKGRQTRFQLSGAHPENEDSKKSHGGDEGGGDAIFAVLLNENNGKDHKFRRECHHAAARFGKKNRSCHEQPSETPLNAHLPG